ncbi:hypothetical protein ACVWZZ_008550 [Bradyrhizobium sp. LM6.10]
MKRLFLVAFVASFVGIASGAAAVWGVWHYKDKVTHAATEKERTDEALAEYTLWLMGFTGLLAFANNRPWSCNDRPVPHRRKTGRDHP